MIVETLTFRLADTADVDAFVRADYRVQTEALPTLPGFLRRTTARNAAGEWVCVTLWATDELAQAADASTADHSAWQEFEELLDPSSVVRVRYQTLE